ncbi:cytidine/deoxycytidylate deaminase zinc-binding region protein [Perkinsela sp. CCAP 1560/4]|nr:cytidine/deoxycytidylate deaminase zinc-binding region protein [Perkinsela sp. CCAP 1560/4]|eukprot:KNH07564.1 cytidine/deoxycytidylate deaminase zinc-binding region protein [Perkinsela sp. CCAP 1560/4]
MHHEPPVVYPYHVRYQLPTSSVDLVTLRRNCRNISTNLQSRAIITFFHNEFQELFPDADLAFPVIPVKVQVTEAGVVTIVSVGFTEQRALHSFFASQPSEAADPDESEDCQCTFCRHALGYDEESKHVRQPRVADPCLPTLPSYLLFIRLIIAKLLRLLCAVIPSYNAASSTAELGKSSRHTHSMFSCKALRITYFASYFNIAQGIHPRKPMATGASSDSESPKSSQKIFQGQEFAEIPMHIRLEPREFAGISANGLLHMHEHSLSNCLPVVRGSVKIDRADGTVRFVMLPLVGKEIKRQRKTHARILSVDACAPCERHAISLPSTPADYSLPICVSTGHTPTCNVHCIVSATLIAWVSSRCPFAVLTMHKYFQEHDWGV